MMTASHYLLPNERMAFIQKIQYLEGIIKGNNDQLRSKDEQLERNDVKLRKYEEENDSLVKNLINVHVVNIENRKKLAEMTEKLAEKETTIVALKKNINFKKSVFHNKLVFYSMLVFLIKIV